MTDGVKLMQRKLTDGYDIDADRIGGRGKMGAD